jgi:hypothetical protein
MLASATAAHKASSDALKLARALSTRGQTGSGLIKLARASGTEKATAHCNLPRL